MKGLKTMVLAGLMLMAPVYAEARLPEPTHISLRDVINTVEQSYRQLSDVRADFSQRTTLQADQRELRGDGELLLAPPGRKSPLMFRFDYFRPANQEIVSNGSMLWIYLPANRQVIQNDLRQVSTASNFNPDRDRAITFLQGLGRISRDFLVSFPSPNRDLDGNYILLLEPREAMVFIQKVFIVVSQDAALHRTAPYTYPFRQEYAFPILATTVIDHQGNSTTMEFSNIRTNTRLPYSTFDFIIPAGAEVVSPPTGRLR